MAAGVNAAVPWWLDVENAPGAAWSGNTQENADFVQGALNALHESEGVADVGIYASPGVWNSIVGDYTPVGPLLDGRLPGFAERTGLLRGLPELGDEPRRPVARAARDRAVRQCAVRRGLRLLRSTGVFGRNPTLCTASVEG